MPYSRPDIEGAVRFYQNYLQPFKGDAFAFLVTLSGMESSFGANPAPRFEYDYSRNSLAYRRSKILQEGYDKYGDMCACSYGPWQILWCVAAELGFELSKNPIELTAPEASLPFVIKLLNRFLAAHVETPEELFLAYNGGLGAVKKPTAGTLNYQKKALSIYQKLTNN